MGEDAFVQAARVTAAFAALAHAVVLQRLAPHAGRRGSWQVN
jgi:hypothetical protein